MPNELAVLELSRHRNRMMENKTGKYKTIDL